MQNSLKKILFAVMFIMLISPMAVFAIQTGNGYTLYDQINSIVGNVGAGGYTADQGGNPMSSASSGNGYTLHAGAYVPYLVSVVNVRVLMYGYATKTPTNYANKQKVIVELRTSTNPASHLAPASASTLIDTSAVITTDANGWTGDIVFFNAPPGDYYVFVRDGYDAKAFAPANITNGNYAPIITRVPLTLGATSTSVDFTDPAIVNTNIGATSVATFRDVTNGIVYDRQSAGGGSGLNQTPQKLISSGVFTGLYAMSAAELVRTSNAINASDYTKFGSYYAAVPKNKAANLNGDTSVNASDFTIMASCYGHEVSVNTTGQTW